MSKKEKSKSEPESELTAKEKIYKAKLEEIDLPDQEKEELLDTLKYVESSEITKEYEKGQLVEDVINSLGEDVATADLDSVGELSDSLNLPSRVVKEVFEQQKSKVEDLAFQELRREKERQSPRWKKILKKVGRPLAYIGGGVGLSILTTPVGAGVAVGGVRMIENLLKGKKRRQQMEKAKEAIKNFLNSDCKEAKDLKNKIREEIVTQLAVSKQEQIEGKEKEKSILGQIISEAEKKYAQGEISKSELKDLYKQQQDSYLNSVEKYLQEQDMSESQIESRKKAARSLITLDQNQKLLEADFQKRNSGFFARAKKKIGKTLGFLSRNETQKERLTTAGIFAFGGILARTCPVVRNIMMGYAGFKGGEFLAKKFIHGSGKFEALKKVSAEQLKSSAENLADVDEKILQRAKVQLANEDFRKKNPIQYDQLKEQIYKIEKAKVEAHSDYIDQANDTLEKVVKEKLSKKKKARAIEWAGKGAGGIVGFVVGDLISSTKKGEETKVSSETGGQESVVHETSFTGTETSEVSGVETVQAGDNVWKVVERQLEKRNVFDQLKGSPQEIQARKDFLIDFYKDKIAENPEAFGVSSGDASLIRAGEEINMTALVENEEMEQKVVEAAQNLQDESIKNINEHREFLEKVLIKSPEEVRDENLVEAVDIMGGKEQAGPGLVGELTQRTNESRINFLQNIEKTQHLQQQFNESTTALQETWGQVHQLQQRNQGIVGWFRRSFFDRRLPDRIAEGQKQLNLLQEEASKQSEALTAQKDALQQSAKDLDPFSPASSEQLMERAHQAMEEPQPVEMTSEELAPKEAVSPEATAEEAAAPEASEGAAEQVGAGPAEQSVPPPEEVSSLGEATAENPIQVEGDKIYQQQGKVIIDKEEGLDYTFSQDATGEYQLEVGENYGYHFTHLTNQANEWLAEGHRQALIDIAGEEGSPMQAGLDQLKLDYNVWLKEGSSSLELLEKAGLGDGAMADKIRRSISSVLGTWVEKYGVENCREIFQDEVLKDYGFLN